MGIYVIICDGDTIPDTKCAVYDYDTDGSVAAAIAECTPKEIDEIKREGCTVIEIGLSGEQWIVKIPKEWGRGGTS